MKRTPLFMETTAIEPERTAAEIHVELVKAGATKIMEEYADGRVVAITFAISANGDDLPFRLPVRTEPVFTLLQKRRKYEWDRKQSAAKDRAQAARVAWRQVYRWVQAQIALIQTGMVQTQEVFFPYLTRDGKTIYEALAESQFKLLPAPSLPSIEPRREFQ